MLALSFCATGMLSTIWTVSVPLLLPPPRSVTVRAWSSLTVRPVRYTRHPAAPRASAIPRPAPLLAPVTTATGRRDVIEWTLAPAARLSYPVSSIRPMIESGHRRLTGAGLGAVLGVALVLVASFVAPMAAVVPGGE